MYTSYASSLAAIFGLLISGCNSAPRGPDKPLTTGANQIEAGTEKMDASVAASDILLTLYDKGQFTMSSRTSGTLERLGHCLVVRNLPGGAAVDYLAFPRGKASWNNATMTLTYYDRHFHLGDNVDFAGGPVGIKDRDAPKFYGLPDVCHGRSVWLLG